MQYTHVAIVVACLLAPCLHWTHATATEDCHFNQYINTKLVSDYSAVLHTITSIADCLAYLKDNKHTQKVVAFDASTQKCCGVLQTLAYEVQPEAGWTTFEIREAVNSSTAEPPSTVGWTSTTTRTSSLGEAMSSSTTPPPSTVGWTSTTTRTSSVSKAVTSTSTSSQSAKTIGICDSPRVPTTVDGDKIVLSLYSHNLDWCYNFSAATMHYNISKSCIFYLDGLKRHIKFDLEYDTGDDILDLYRGTLAFNGKGSYSGVIPSVQLKIDYLSWSNTAKKGFCLTVSATDENATVASISESATMPQLNSTIGVCSYYQSNIKLQEDYSTCISVYSYDFDLCSNFNAVKLYNVSRHCITSLYSSSNFRVKFNIEYDTGESFVVLHYYGGSLVLAGKGSYSGVTTDDKMTIEWNSWKATPKKGFFMTANPTTESATLEVLPYGYIEHDADKTIGICDYYHAYIEMSSNKTAIISVQSYDFNLCTNFGSAKLYNVSKECSTLIYEADYDQNLKFSIEYDIGHCCGYIQVGYYQNKMLFSKKGAFSGIVHSNYLDVKFVYWGNTPIKGFCMTVTKTAEQPTEIPFETAADPEFNIANEEKYSRFLSVYN